MSSQATVLITGGAGYIGSHLVHALQETSGSPLVILDNLATGFAEAVPASARLIVGDIKDTALLDNLMANEAIETVIHLAASTVIPESLHNPGKYYDNNTFGTLNLLQACAKHHVKYFIFSSTAAVYAPSNQKLKEESPTLPQNPYGHSKLMAEQMIKDFAKAHELRYIILRYFNVAGASLDGLNGQRHAKASHLIKTAVQTACGLLPNLPIFGTDYPTLDGTCIRDFIHVSDLANAHIQALHYLQRSGESLTLNCGYGHGYSVKEVIATLEKILGKTLPVTLAPRRAGDLPEVIAETSAIEQISWRPQFNSLTTIVESALNWEKKLQQENIG
jgi:UDP-glucose 4-epimerase